MNRYLSWTCWALIGILFFAGYIVSVEGASAPGAGDQASSGTEVKTDSQTGYLENILFEKSAGRERVVLVLSRQAGAQIDSKTKPSLQVRIPNTFVPEDLRKPLGQGALANVLRAVPAQKMEQGKPLALITIDLQNSRPYMVKQEGNNVVIDFNVGAQTVQEEGKIVTAAAAPEKQTSPAAGEATETKAKYTGQKISIDFQDADLRDVLRLLGEQAGKSIVTSPEVKGTTTISMQQVPWDQVLDTILDLNGLTKKEEGKVITVLTMARAKQDEADRAAAIDLRKKAEDAAKKAENERDLEKGKLKQLMIEAKILEVNETFLRDLGVRWGTGVQTNLGNSDYSMGLLGGTSSLTTPLTKLTTGVALTRDALAMSLGTIFEPTLGIILGGSNAVLNAQIGAMETNSNGRLLSSPRVLTQDTQKAIIEQGEEVPVVTPGTSTNPPTTTYKQATLRLEVTPEIKQDNHILLTIKAKNDRPNRAEKDLNTGNIPIFTSSVDSKVVVKDGDTVVIGGILKTDDNKTTTGVPWLSQIPILGWLFKYESINNNRRELLIFLTPRIIKADEAGFTRM
jgi:type IV pilus assembly protein PilQ